MSFRRIANAATTIVVAIVVALAVPVSQLRTVSIVKSCCCPDPSNCHCPDHKQPDKGEQPSMRACHSSQQITVAPEMPSFSPPVVAIASAPERIAVAPVLPLRSPHASPPPAQPDGPS